MIIMIIIIIIIIIISTKLKTSWTYNLVTSLTPKMKNLSVLPKTC